MYKWAIGCNIANGEFYPLFYFKSGTQALRAETYMSLTRQFTGFHSVYVMYVE